MSDDEKTNDPFEQTIAGQFSLAEQHLGREGYEQNLKNAEAGERHTLAGAAYWESKANAMNAAADVLKVYGTYLLPIVLWKVAKKKWR